MKIKCKNNGLLRTDNTKGVIPEKKGKRMAEDGDRLEMAIILKSLANFFRIHER